MPTDYSKRATSVRVELLGSRQKSETKQAKLRRKGSCALLFNLKVAKCSPCRGASAESFRENFAIKAFEDD